MRLESNPLGFQGTPTWRNATGFRCKATGLGCRGPQTWRKGIGLGCKAIGLGCSGTKPWREATRLKCKGTGLGCSGTETWRKATIAGFKRTLKAFPYLVRYTSSLMHKGLRPLFVPHWSENRYMCFFVQHKRWLWFVVCDRQPL